MNRGLNIFKRFQHGAEAVPEPLPEPPTVDPPNPYLDEILRTTLEGAGLSPEQLREVREHPGSLNSISNYALWAGIMMGGGKGRHQPRFGPKGAVPIKVWESWKPAGAAPEGGAIKVDEAGNYFQQLGSHETVQSGRPDKGDIRDYHAIVKPVGKPGSAEAYYQKHQEMMATPPEQMKGEPSYVDLQKQIQNLEVNQDIQAAIQQGKKGMKDPAAMSDYMDQIKTLTGAYPQKVIESQFNPPVELSGKIPKPPKFQDEIESGPYKGQHPFDPAESEATDAYWKQFGEKHGKDLEDAYAAEDEAYWKDFGEKHKDAQVPPEKIVIKPEDVGLPPIEKTNAKLDWEKLPEDIKRQYPDPEILTEKDWFDINDYLKQIQAGSENPQFLPPEEPPFNFDDLEPPPPKPRFQRGTVSVEKGYGPRHAFNAQEGFQSGTNNVERFNVNPFVKPTTSGFNTGVPTQRVISGIFNFLGNLAFPGLGTVLTGPMATAITRMIQNGANKQDVANYIQQQQGSSGGQGDGTRDATTDPYGLHNPPPAGTAPQTPSQGVGIDPWGNPADPGEWWSNDFGRWKTDPTGDFPGGYNLSGPGGGFGSRGTDFTTGANIGGSGTVGNLATAIGFGAGGGGIGAGDVSRFRGRAGGGRALSEWEYDTSPSSHGWGQGPPGSAATPRPSYEQYLEMFNPLGTEGSSTGPGGHAQFGIGSPGGTAKAGSQTQHTPKRAVFAMGTTSVNPALKIYHRRQLKRKKP